MPEKRTGKIQEEEKVGDGEEGKDPSGEEAKDEEEKDKAKALQAWTKLWERGYNLRLSSLDFAVYAYVKEELVNSDDQPTVKHLKKQCPRLMAFIHLMDFLFD